MALVCLLAIPASVAATRPNTHHRPCHSDDLPALAEKVWSKHKWERGVPKPAVIRAARRVFGCAKHPGPLIKKWKAEREIYFGHRKAMLWLEEFKPFIYPDGTRWAVPYPIAWCESGGDYYVGPSGAYGLIPPFPQWLSPREQDRIAHDLYVEQGEGPWAPYEGACAYR